MAELAPTPWRVDVPDDAALHALARPAALRPTVSLYLQTDPRIAANAAQTPAWLVTARNGLRDVTAALDDNPDRDARLRWRDLRHEVEAELEALAPADRGRSLVWFLDLEGTLDDRYILQVPLRDSVVTLAEQPVIAPLIELLDHSRPVGVVLVSGERVRLVHWAHGRIDEAGEEVFDLEGSDGWKPYRGPASGRGGAAAPARRTSSRSSRASRSTATASSPRRAQATAQRLEQLRWERVVIAAERADAARFRHHLPATVADARRRRAAARRHRRPRVGDRATPGAGDRGPAPA